ncbi:hypothetical protein QE152_g15727 [Popillia japonica]|uniref:Uncharacterized protein n=1 Tax=Popillia japonica TaxID=7064 RepID=A0AAW1L859_POPJA
MEIITDMPQPTTKPIQSFDHVTEMIENAPIITDMPQPTTKPIQSFDHVTEMIENAPVEPAEHGEKVAVVVPEALPCPPGAICEEPSRAPEKAETPVEEPSVQCKVGENCEIPQENIPQVCANEEDCKQTPITECPPGVECQKKAVPEGCPEGQQCEVISQEEAIPCAEGADCTVPLPIPTENEEKKEHDTPAPSVPEVIKEHETESPILSEDHTKLDLEENELGNVATSEPEIKTEEPKLSKPESPQQSELPEEIVTESKAEPEVTTTKAIETNEIGQPSEGEPQEPEVSSEQQPPEETYSATPAVPEKDNIPSEIDQSTEQKYHEEAVVTE